MPEFDDARPLEDTRTKASRYFDRHREPQRHKRDALGLTALASLMPTIPGLALAGAMTATKTYAPSPVWKGSTTQPVKFLPVLKEQAWTWYRQAGEWFRGLDALLDEFHVTWCRVTKIYEVLISQFLNFTTGQLDPSIEGIAQEAKTSQRHVVRVLAFLQKVGVLFRIRRCSHEDNGEGKLVWKQERNAYFILSPAHWRGYIPPPAPPPPAKGTWGDDARSWERGTVAAGTFDREYEMMEMEATARSGDGVAQALANLGRSMAQRALGALNLPECQDGAETPSEIFLSLKNHARDT